MKLTVSGKAGYIPSVDGTDLVGDGGKADTSADVTDWLLTKLANIHSQAKQIITDHLASIRSPEAGGTGYSAIIKRRKGR